jgi:hypothetical protein
MNTSDTISLGAKASLLEFPDPGSSYEWSADELTNMDFMTVPDLEECILEATIRGHERLVRTLMDRRGPVRIVVAEHPKVPGRYTLNGREMARQIDERMFATGIKTPGHLKSLLSMIVEFGMKGLLEPGQSFPLLLKAVDTNSVLMSKCVSEYEADLPELIDGVLDHPELAIALVGEINRTPTPDAYKPMLCWASESMVRQFRDHLAPLKHFQTVMGHGPIAQWKAASGQPGNLDFSAIHVGVEPVKAAAAEVFQFLRYTMLPMASKLGFEDERGRVLCVTSSDFLIQFPSRNCSEANLQAALEFAGNYCPVDIMASQASAICREQFGRSEPTRAIPVGYMREMSASFNDLFECLQNDHPLREQMTNLIARDQWVALFDKTDKIDAKALLGLYHAFGIDNTGKGRHFYPHAIATLASGGFKFSSKTKIFTDEKKFQKHVESADLSLEPAVELTYDKTCFDEHSGPTLTTREIFANCMKANLWPIPGAAPAGVPQALKDSSRLSFEVLSNPKKLALYTYLQRAGVEACVEAASTPSQWMSIAQIFSCEDLQPYLKDMPKQARGKVLESGLGL